ncbi:glycosyltransferase [Hyunsoonleella pacifica]|uniref:Glycosyltransferase n=1 Tax=Hyunsoonleella pacifica TaxID=1080224 RepID=A0A4Q9FT04_9FLAO|nr:glycosyltransferase [Hyunsoonleella pacifica]TBN18509.1 glycosyltransferase [Hyunsoonleella pacifica]
MNCKVFIYAYIDNEISPQFKDLANWYKLDKIFRVQNPLASGSSFKYLKIRTKLLLFALKLRKHNPDIIIPYLNGPSIIAAYCRRISGAKVAFWNNRGIECFRKNKLEKNAVSKTKFFLVNSKEAIGDMKNNFKISSSNIYFLPNFLAISQNEIKIKQNSKKEIVVGMLAHFREEKLHELLLQSFVELLKKYPNIKLHLVGNTSNKGRIKKLKTFVENNQLTAKVAFIHNSTPERELPKFDIGVLVSEKEGMSNSVMEYMYYGLPIICTNHSSNTLLLGNKSEFLIENNKQELNKKLEILINSNKKREFEGMYNKKRIEDEFGVEKYVLKLEHIFNNS